MVVLTHAQIRQGLPEYKGLFTCPALALRLPVPMALLGVLCRGALSGIARQQHKGSCLEGEAHVGIAGTARSVAGHPNLSPPAHGSSSVRSRQ